MEKPAAFHHTDQHPLLVFKRSVGPIQLQFLHTAVNGGVRVLQRGQIYNAVVVARPALHSIRFAEMIAEDRTAGKYPLIDGCFAGAFLRIRDSKQITAAPIGAELFKRQQGGQVTLGNVYAQHTDYGSIVRDQGQGIGDDPGFRFAERKSTAPITKIAVVPVAAVQGGVPGLEEELVLFLRAAAKTERSVPVWTQRDQMFLGNGSRSALDQKVGVIYGIVVGIGIADIQSRPQGFPRRFFRRRAVQNQKRAGRAGLAKHGNQRLGGILHDFFIQRRVLPDIRGKGSGLVKRFPDFDQNGVFPVLDAGPAMNHLVFQIEFPVEGAFWRRFASVRFLPEKQTGTARPEPAWRRKPAPAVCGGSSVRGEADCSWP